MHEQLPCPAMHECTTKSATPTLCAAGTYSDGAQLSCSTCVAGHMCTVGHLLCPTGFYSPVESEFCTICPPGYECPEESAEPVACAEGEYALSGFAECKSIASGYISDGNIAPVPCPDGTYVDNPEVCTQSPAGMKWVDLVTVPTEACDDGYYSLVGWDECVACEEDYYCPDVDSEEWFHCPQGYYLNSAQTACEECGEGYMCPDGVNQIACSSPYYSLSSTALTCLGCPPGTKFTSTSTACQSCGLGYYSIYGQNTCQQCPAGFYCPLTENGYPIICEQGYYSDVQASECIVCPQGYQCYFDGSTPTTCPTGTYSPEGEFDCIDAIPGTYATGSEAEPIECESTHDNAETSDAGVSLCALCSGGNFCANTYIEVVCPAGWYSDNGASYCSICPQGYYCPESSTYEVSAQNPIACPTGAYCPAGSSNPRLCPGGTFQQTTLKTAVSDCQTCSEGSYCPPGSSLETSCPQGFFCKAGTAYPYQTPCEPDNIGDDALYGASDQLISRGECQTCSEGMFCPPGSSSEKTCPPGFYCPSGTLRWDDNPVPAGSYIDGEGCIALGDLGCDEICPVGNYCPRGSSYPIPCPPGTYNPSTGSFDVSACLPCPAGKSCPQHGMSSTNDCTAGHFCPQWTIFPTDFKCPEGTYTDSNSLESMSQCTICPSGISCKAGSTSADYESCLPGHYCPQGSVSSNQFMCPNGTYNPVENATSINSCVKCDAGYFCLAGAKYPTGICPPGYYCPLATQNSTQYPCSAGTYNSYEGNSTQDACLSCPEGHYCPEGTAEPVECNPGYYSDVLEATLAEPSGSDPSAITCKVCPEGYYCLDGQIDPIPCPAGLWSDNGAYECRECPAGHYCYDETYETGVSVTAKDANVCAEGLWCPESTDHTPSLPGDACSMGHYCPEGTTYEVECEPGSYLAAVGGTKQGDCTDCPAGNYCSGGKEGIDGDCEVGYYCPVYSSSPQQEPCPAGTYNNLTNAEDSDWCVMCPEGYYCPEATSEPEDCPQGYYCPPGIEFPIPCPPGTYSPSFNLGKLEECTVCPTGRYCAGLASLTPTGLCEPGYYCISGAFSPIPIGNTGHICDAGYYCELGALRQEPCSPGYYNPDVGGKSSDSCLPCPAGKYCDGTTSSPTGACEAGYYCVGIATNAQQYIVQPGYYSETGASEASPCEPSEYNPNPGQSSCTECPEGFYCDEYKMTAPKACKEGTYCPAGSENPLDCPTGSYSNEMCLVKKEQCEACPPGMYCASNRLSEPTGLCYEGYTCTLSATVPFPTNEEEFGGLICPAGSYCLEGTFTDIKCPIGTYNPYEGKKSIDNCLPCKGGMACPEEGIDTPDVVCSEGYYCVEGATTPTPIDQETGDICPRGYYCESGSASPTPCEAGSYAQDYGQSSCDECPIGYYCPVGTADPIICPKGYYCGAGATEAVPCIKGTFSNLQGLKTLNECTLCPGGYYCPSTALTDYLPYECLQGYYCTIGCANKRCTEGHQLVGAVCPLGNYCPTGSADPIKCPAGTYRPNIGGTSISSCYDCPAGKYCLEGVSEYDDDCAAGYYCSGGSSTSTPTDAVMGNICPSGHYCEKGSTEPTACPKGYYQDAEGQSSCIECPSGYYCPEETVNYLENECPQGYYCLSQTKTSTSYPCPVGTYSNSTGLSAKSECTPCPPGYYCGGIGLNSPSGECALGYYCGLSATASAPSESENNGKCPSGYYCPVGSAIPQICPPGYTCDGGPADPAICEEGYYCVQPDDSLEELVFDCPAGYYCPAGSSEPSACPPKTYQPLENQVSNFSCISCPEGYACEEPAQSSYITSCSAGYYCPEGQNTPEPAAYLCPAGFYCPADSTEPTACVGGEYQPLMGQSEPLACPEGYYCEGETVTPEICPVGHWCPEGTEFFDDHPCSIATYNPIEGATSVGNCLECPAGYLCSESALDMYDTLCPEGYYCPQRTTPTQLEANICDRGHYCPEGSSVPTPCPVGTYSSEMGMTSLSDCDICPGGSYCAQEGLYEVTGECSEGWYCISAATSPTPSTDGGSIVTGGICLEGHYCPAGSSSPTECEKGYYADEPGFSSCKECPAGYYCPTTGVVDPIPCPAGYYCEELTIDYNSFPCPIGTYSPFTGLEQQSECLSCPKGSYCAELGITEVTGPCDAGYLCVKKSYTATPISSTISKNKPCPAGYYCSQGALSATPCPPGTYNPLTGSIDDSACIDCPSGYYCDEWGMPSFDVSKKCAEGYYCTEGSYTPTPDSDSPFGGICPVGTYCKSGSSEPTDCLTGTYNSLQGQSSCETCPAGYYCDVEGISIPPRCLTGYYCPLGTINPVTNNYYCPAGTFNDLEGITSRSQCTPCLPGYACTTVGLSEPDVICEAGYMCISHASSPTPSSDSYGNGVCTAGYYCEEGTYEPLPCPVGTYNRIPGLKAIDECTDCDAGKYCSTAGSSSPTGKCAGGYYCLGSANMSAPTDGVTGAICPAGSYCAAGSSSTTLCAKGYFSEEGSSECQECPSGYYCPSTGTVNPTLCPEGYYCPTGTYNYENNKCPTGTYNDLKGATSVGHCMDCPPGYACPNLATTTPTVKCSEGYFCTGGSYSATPNDLPDNGPCSPGYYCPEGSSHETPCPAGTYNPSYTQPSIDSCLSCPPGYYCMYSATSDSDLKCFSRYYCPTDSYALDGSPDSYLCPKGSYCEEGASTPVSCAAGTYANSFGHSSCLECPKGYYCELETVDPVICPLGYYCPLGSKTATACPHGTYGEVEGLVSSDDCTDCPPGKYCRGGQIQGSCYAGYACYRGSSIPNPTLPEGEVCPSGSYCEEGTEYPIPCPDDTFSLSTQSKSLADCEDCPAGSVCISGYQLDCSPGYYCPLGVSETECPTGTYNPKEGSTSASDCLSCPEGYYCNETALANLDYKACPSGYYCPEGTIDPEPCPGGTYRLEKGGKTSNDCTVCSTGNYCSEGASAEIMCDDGYYCPEGSEDMTLCGLGTYFLRTVDVHTEYDNTCFSCPEGEYCNADDRLSTATCAAGYICTGGASVPNPTTDEEGGYVCPAGYYCEAGDIEPSPCPMGTYSDVLGLETKDGCNLCPENTYNPTPGAAECIPCGETSYSELGATECICLGNNRAYQEDDMTCQCFPGYEFYDSQNQLSEGDSVIDCQPHVYSQCTNGRDSLGHCIIVDDSGNADVCEKRCVSGTGVHSNGICTCEDAQDIDNVCDSICRANSPKLSLTPSSAGVLQIELSDGSVVEIDSSESASLVGSTSCTYGGNCEVSMLKLDSTGFFGVLDFDYTTLQSTIDDNAESGAVPGSVSRREDTNTEKTVSYPLLCLEYGQTVMWELTSESYPVYQKDSLFNTNNNFDYSFFSSLPTLLSSSTATLVAFSFTSPGVYVFADSDDEYHEVMIAVMDENESCGDSLTVNTLSTDALSVLGISVSTDIILAPNWILILILLFVTACIIAVIILILVLYNRIGWISSKKIEPLYRKTGGKDSLDSYVSVPTKRKVHLQLNPEVHHSLIGTGESAMDRASAEDIKMLQQQYWEGGRAINLHGFSVPRLYKELENQTSNVQQHVDEQNEKLVDFYKQISGDINELGRILEDCTKTLNKEQDMMRDALVEGGKEKELREAKRKGLARQYVKFLDYQIKCVQNELSQLRNRDLLIWKEFAETLDTNNSTREVIRRMFEDRSTKNFELAHKIRQSMHARTTQLNKHILSEFRRRFGQEKYLVPAVGNLSEGPNSPPISNETFVGKVNPKTELRSPLEIPGLTYVDPVTGLFHATPGSCVQVGNVDVIPVSAFNSKFFCIEPETGRLVLTCAAVFVEKATGSVKHLIEIIKENREDILDMDYIPFVPTPSNITSLPINPAHKKIFQKNGKTVMIDPETGLRVPVIGATIDPKTLNPVPLGGTCEDAFSGATVPIVYGQPIIPASIVLDDEGSENEPEYAIFDEESEDDAAQKGPEMVLPISGIRIHPTGKVIPICTGFTDYDSIDTPASFGIIYYDEYMCENLPLVGTCPLMEKRPPQPYTGQQIMLTYAHEIFSERKLRRKIGEDFLRASQYVKKLTEMKNEFDAKVERYKNDKKKLPVLYTDYEIEMNHIKTSYETFLQKPLTSLPFFENFRRAQIGVYRLWLSWLHRLANQRALLKKLSQTGAVSSTTAGFMLPHIDADGIFTGGVDGANDRAMPAPPPVEMERLKKIIEAEHTRKNGFFENVSNLHDEIYGFEKKMISKLREMADGSISDKATVQQQHKAIIDTLSNIKTPISDMNHEITENRRENGAIVNLLGSDTPVSTLLRGSIDHATGEETKCLNEFLQHHKSLVTNLRDGVSDILKLDLKILDRSGGASVLHSRERVSKLKPQIEALTGQTRTTFVDLLRQKIAVEISAIQTKANYENCMFFIAIQQILISRQSVGGKAKSLLDGSSGENKIKNVLAQFISTISQLREGQFAHLSKHFESAEDQDIAPRNDEAINNMFSQQRNDAIGNFEKRHSAQRERHKTQTTQQHAKQVSLVKAPELQARLASIHRRVSKETETDDDAFVELQEKLITNKFSISQKRLQMNSAAEDGQVDILTKKQQFDEHLEQLRAELEVQCKAEVKSFLSEMEQKHRSVIDAFTKQHEREEKLVPQNKLNELTEFHQKQRESLLKNLEEEKERQFEIFRRRQEAVKAKRLAELDLLHKQEALQDKKDLLNHQHSSQLAEVEEEITEERLRILNQMKQEEQNHLQHIENELINNLRREANPAKHEEHVAEYERGLKNWKEESERKREERLADLEARRKERIALLQQRRQQESEDLAASSEHALKSAEQELAHAEFEIQTTTDEYNMIETLALQRNDSVSIIGRNFEKNLRTALSPEEKARIFETHQHTLEAFSEELKAEQTRQNDLLSLRLQQRRQRQENATDAPTGAMEPNLHEAQLASSESSDDFSSSGHDDSSMDLQIKQDIERHLGEKEGGASTSRSESERSESPYSDAARDGSAEFEASGYSEYSSDSYTRSVSEAQDASVRISQVEHKFDRALRKETREMQRTFEKDRMRALEECDRKFEKERERIRLDQQKKDEERMKNASSVKSQKQLVEELQEKQKQLMGFLDYEQERQREELEARMQERFRKRAELLKKRNELAKQETVRPLQEQKREEKRAKRLEAEQQTIAKIIEERGNEQASKIIELVLKERHLAETQELFKEFERHKRSQQEKLALEFEEVYDPRREKMSDDQALEIQELFRQRLDYSELEERHTELVKRHRIEHSQLNHQMTVEFRKALDELNHDLTVGYSQNRARQARDQMREISEIMGNLFSNMFVSDNEEIKHQRLLLQQVQRRVQEEKKLEKERIQREKEELREQHRQMMKERFQKLEEEHQQELERERERLEREQQAKELRRKNKILENRERELRKQRDLPENKREGLMDKYKSTLEGFEQAVQEEREQQEAEFKERLQRRLQRRKERMRKELNTELQEELTRKDDESKQRMQAIEDGLAIDDETNVTQALRTAQSFDAPRTRMTATAFDSFATDFSHGRSATPVSEGERIDRFVGVANLNEQLSAHLSSVVDMTAQLYKYSKFTLKDPISFVDKHDASIRNEGSLVAVPPAQLNKAQRAVFNRAAEILDFLGQSGYAHFRLGVAAQLPHTEIEEADNVYCRSYIYERDTRTVYIRIERFAKLGKLVLILCHALAHIRAKTWSDVQPRFKREFFKLNTMVSNLLCPGLSAFDFGAEPPASAPEGSPPPIDSEPDVPMRDDQRATLDALEAKMRADQEKHRNQEARNARHRISELKKHIKENKARMDLLKMKLDTLDPAKNAQEYKETKKARTQIKAEIIKDKKEFDDLRVLLKK
eukprot:gnl/Chilomastix_cuspidata/1248.p1 GENE.gnl/Chilomastix_cuspidata/1248~~gnl/Chilomastix_cuspidata/1248.p1  ORF type:complete len:6697 (-),score=752.02 gnl/Chilomastix_cuspidata/1248:22-17397(-)